MREPGTVLALEPLEQPVGEEGRMAVLGRSIGLRLQRPLSVVARLVSQSVQPRQPRLQFVEAEADVEARQHAFVREEPGVVGVADHTGIDALIGVAEQGRREAGPPSGVGDVVEPLVEGCPIGDDPVVHLVGARVQHGPPGRARRRLAVVPREADPVRGELVEVRRADQRMPGRRQAVAAELVERDEQDVHEGLRLAPSRRRRAHGSQARMDVADTARP